MKYTNIVFFLLLVVFADSASADIRSGETVTVTGVVNDDVYAAGGEVDSSARIAGDLVAAGGRLDIVGEVLADVLAAGGEVNIRGRIHDDVRIAGGDLVIQALIRDDLVAAGGRIRITENSRIGGTGSLAGGEVYVDGRIDGPLQVSAGKVVIAGSVGSDVSIWAEDIIIMPGARIAGDLNYQSPDPALINEGAEITGEVIHTPVDMPAGPIITGMILMAAVIYLTLMVTAIVLYLLFTDIAAQTAQIANDSYWSCVGLGLAILTATPLVIVILMSIGIGSLLAVIVLLSYLLLLITGYISGAYSFTVRLRNVFNSTSESRLTASIWLAVTLLLLSITGLVPLLGFIVSLLILTSGMGSLVRVLILTKNDVSRIKCDES
jgi:cytoskeletal protein CcmA (bactofilin family)